MNRRCHPFDTIKYIDVVDTSLKRSRGDGRKQIDTEADEGDEGSGGTFCAYVSTPKKTRATDSGKGTGEDFPVLFFLLHGAGCTSMTWAPLVRKMSEEHYVAAFDARAHGQTRTSDESNLALSTLSSDALHVLKAIIFEMKRPKTSSPVRIVLVGHSMGGAVAVALSRLIEIERCDAFRVVGCAIVEMVGKTALASADRNEAYLRDRPKRFLTVEDAVRWACRSRFVANRQSAAMSVPSCLVRVEKEADTESSSSLSSSYVWRTDVLSTKRFWSDWFDDLSERFLSLRVPKLVILSHAGKLDTPMTIAHMSGKIQLRVVRDGGHMVHENFPSVVATMFVEFAKRSVKVGLSTTATSRVVVRAQNAKSNDTKRVSFKSSAKMSVSTTTRAGDRRPVLIVAPDKKRSGNASTSRRIMRVLESACGERVVRRAPVASVQEALAVLQDVEPILLVCIHAVKSSSFLDIAESRRPPTILVFGGTDLNVYAKTNTTIESDIRRRCRTCAFVVSFTSEMTLKPPPVDGGRLRVVPHGVTIAATSKSDESKAEALYRAFATTNGDEKRVLLLLAGIRPVKDVCYLVDHVEAAFESSAAMRDYVLVIAGPVIDEAYANFVRERTKGSAHVTFAPGGIEHSVACALMRRCTALVNSSVSEGSSVAIKEARAMGVPVFARDVPGNRATLRQLSSSRAGDCSDCDDDDDEALFGRVSNGAWLYRDPPGFVAALRDHLGTRDETKKRGAMEGPRLVDAMNKREEAGWVRMHRACVGRAGGDIYI
eukprot:g927.t1